MFSLDIAFLSSFFWPYFWHAKVPGPVIKPAPQQQLQLLW